MAASSRNGPRKPSPPRPSSARSRSSDPATFYADQVLAGRIVAGELVKAACERHKRDLKDGRKRGLVWVPTQGTSVQKAAFARQLRFFPSVLSVTAGTRAGKPFKLLAWHEFFVASVFGWQLSSGRLRFRSAWAETGKGQAKSPIMAAMGLYFLGWHGVPRAEVYAIAQDKDQANVVFKDAVAMVRAPIPGTEHGETLESLRAVVVRGTLDNSWKIEHPDSGSKFQALANDEAVSGPRPLAVLADEVHEYKTTKLIEDWQRALTKMPGDAIMLLGTNTPGTTQPVGTAYADYYADVARGKIQDDAAFSYIARVDKADHDTILDNEAAWPKSLPALGQTFPVENLRDDVRKAKQFYSTAASVKRLYFGIRVGAVEFWIAEHAWAAVQATVIPAAHKGQACWLSLDLSDKNDLTALTAIWLDEDGHLYAKTWYWTAEEGLDDRATADRAPYRDWQAAGWLNVVPGPVIDKSFVAVKVREICAEHDVRFLAFDPAGIEDFTDACQEIGFETWRWKGPKERPGTGLPLVSHAQGKRVVFEDKQLCMPRSIERLEDRILTRRITVDDSPLTYFCAGNAMVDQDAQANRCFDKKHSRGRIDGLVTLAMATGAATSPLEVAPASSVYESRPLLVF